MINLVEPSITQLGYIKIGGLQDRTLKAGSTGRSWSPPEKWDHFKVMLSYRNDKDRLVPDDELMDQLIRDGMADPDGKLRQIPIQVLSNDIEDVLQMAYLYYSGNKLAARYDGETLTWHCDIKKGTWLEKPIVEEMTVDEFKEKRLPMLDKSGNPLFKLHSIFNCVIQAQNARWGGVYRFRTGSEISARQLLGSLNTLRDLTGGILRGIPMRLALRPIKVNPLVKGSKKTSTVYVVHVELRATDLIDVQAKAIELAKFELANQHTRVEYRKLLAAPGEYESEHEQAANAMEFGSESGETITNEADPLADALGFGNEPEPTVEPEPTNEIADEPEIDAETIPETTSETVVDNSDSFEPILPAQVQYLTGILQGKATAFLKVMSDRWTISAFDKIPVSLFDEIKKAAFEYAKPQEEKK